MDSESSTMENPGAVFGRIRLADVAAAAGVSKGTASKALNDEYGVSDRTRARVLDAAARLGFTPNEVARSLTSGRSETVGLLTTDLDGRFALPIMSGAERALSGAAGSSILLSNSGGNAAEEVSRALGLLSRRVDALILVGDRADPRSPLAINTGIPLVYAYAPSTDPSDASVAPDDFAGGAMAARHLREQGRRRVAYIGGLPAFAANQQRRGGARSVSDELFAVADGLGWSDEAGWAETLDMLDRRPDIDGLICASDLVGLGALAALSSRGRRVPDDVAVVAFDNLDFVSGASRPRMTSVDLNLPELGAASVRKIQSAEGGGDISGTELVPPTLVIRESCGGHR